RGVRHRCDHWRDDGLAAPEAGLVSLDNQLWNCARCQAYFRADRRVARGVELEARPPVARRRRIRRDHPSIRQDGAHLRRPRADRYFGACEPAVAEVAARGGAFFTYLSSQLMYSHSRWRCVSTAV